VNIGNPAADALAADLSAARFQAGVARGQWRIIASEFPLLFIAVAAIEPGGTAGEYSFRLELTGFPGTAPEVRIWDYSAAEPLAQARRPRGSPRVIEAFKTWGHDTVYRPGGTAQWCPRRLGSELSESGLASRSRPDLHSRGFAWATYFQRCCVQRSVIRLNWFATRESGTKVSTS